MSAAVLPSSRRPLGMSQRLPLREVMRQIRPALMGIAAAWGMQPGIAPIMQYLRHVIVYLVDTLQLELRRVKSDLASGGLFQQISSFPSCYPPHLFMNSWPIRDG